MTTFEASVLEIPVIETPRLRLRGFRRNEFEEYASVWAEPEVTRFIGGVPLSREAAWTRFLRHAGLWHHLGFGFFAIEDKETGRLVGEAGFHDLRRPLSPSIEGTMETGWGLRKAFQGKGLAEEAVRAALSWADTHFPAFRQTCIIQAEHAASIRVAEKLGFVEFARSQYGGNVVILFERRRPGGV